MRLHVHEVSAALAVAGRYPLACAATLATTGCVVLAGSLTLVTLMRLPALVMAAPWAFSVSLWAIAIYLALLAHRRRGTARMDADVERRIIEVAVASGGRMTTTGVAHALSIPLSEADGALTALSKAGYLSIEAQPDSGVLVYTFPDVVAGLVPARAPTTSEPLETGPVGTPFLAAPHLPAGAALSPPGSPLALVRISNKSRVMAAALAICGGVFGAHKFYLGEPLGGVIRLALFWTLLPMIVGVLEGVGYLLMSDQTFELKHNARLG